MKRCRRVRLVPGWRRCWRWFSQQCMAISIAIQGGWAAMPSDLKAGIPSIWVTIAAISVLVLGMIGRLIDQGGNDADRSGK